jgi:hypothetical protein
MARKFTAEDLAEPLKLLITGSAIPPEVGTLQEIMERVRIICSIYDPVTGRYRTNYSLVFPVRRLPHLCRLHDLSVDQFLEEPAPPCPFLP